MLQHGHAPQNVKGRTVSAWLTETAFSSPMAPAVKHPASPREGINQILLACPYYSITVQSVNIYEGIQERP
jgi:hypothetical protein